LRGRLLAAVDLEKHGPAHAHHFAVLRRQDGPVGFGNGLRLRSQNAQQAMRVIAANNRSATQQRSDHANRGIQRSQFAPVIVGERIRDEPFVAGAQVPHAPAQRIEEGTRRRPAAPGFRGHQLRMDVCLGKELFGSDPAAPYRRIHQLHQAADPAPDHHEMRHTAGQFHYQ
jgi:hypothetical protein